MRASISCTSATIGLFGILAFGPPAFADKITVDVIGPTGGVSGINIVDPGEPPGVSVSVYAGTPNGSSTLVKSGTTNSSHTFSSTFPVVTGPSNLTIVIGTVAPEHFTINPTTGTGLEFQSDEQKLNNANNLRSLAASLDSSSWFFAEAGTSYVQFGLTNISTSNAYAFTALKLYTDLNTSFFNAIGFDSVAAIASGVLAKDFVALNGGNLTIPVSGQAANPETDFSSAFTNPGGYELLIGIARPILVGGGLGAPQDFAIAASSIPEPDTRALLGVALLSGLAFRKQLFGPKKTG